MTSVERFGLPQRLSVYHTVKEDLKAQGMNMREAVDNRRNRKTCGGENGESIHVTD